MQEEETYYRFLLTGFINNQLEPAELQELLEFIQQQPEFYERLATEPAILQQWKDQANNSGIDISPALSQRMKERLLKAIPRPSVPLYRRAWLRYAAAAIILAGSLAIWLATTNKNNTAPAITATQATKNDVAPGGNHATLTLANGSRIILDSTANGAIGRQGNMQIIKLDSGKLAYRSTVNDQPSTTQYNTITTPRGGQYQLELSDGTRAWLNAASTITYPAAFNGKEREVTITGEVYFEVAKAAAHPFIVHMKGGRVAVLGTHFNINAYEDEEEVKTTLLEGLVKVTPGENGGDTGSTVIKPGEQATLARDGRLTTNKKADLDQTMAWKNGLFYFKGAEISAIMRQVAQWYDVEVKYEGKPPTGHYNGKTSRNLNLSAMLKVLEESGVKFTIEGKTITVKN